MAKGKRVVKPGQLERRENRVGYLFILPWLIGFLALVAWPMIQSFQYSLNKIKLLPQGMAKLYVGFENYSQIFLTDPDFIMGLETYLTETLIAVPVIVAFALIIAMLLNEKIACRGLFRMIFFLPIIIASRSGHAAACRPGGSQHSYDECDNDRAAIGRISAKYSGNESDQCI